MIIDDLSTLVLNQEPLLDLLHEIEDREDISYMDILEIVSYVLKNSYPIGDVEL